MPETVLPYLIHRRPFGCLRRASRGLAPAWGLVATLACVACGGPATAPAVTSKKLVILGFDGMDPDLVREWMAEGKLPNLAKLAAKGGLYDLQTSHSPESPTAWASFATGVNAGKHNIYDFLVRDTQTYLPDLGMVKRTPPNFLFNYIPTSRPVVESIRGGTSFWVTAGKGGIRSSILTVPVTYPPEEVPNGELLSGLPLPDIRGTMGTFYYFATDLSRYEEGNTEFGGILKRVVFDGTAATTEIVGPPNPIVRQQVKALRSKPGGLGDEDRAHLAELDAVADVRVPMTLSWQRDAQTLTVGVQGQTVTLKPGEWSRWLELEFKVNLLIRPKGMVQLFLIRADRDLQLYMSPVNWLPQDPPLPMSAPAALSKELAATLGPYRTLGWAEATWPLEEGRLDEKAFMDDLYRAFDDRARVILNRLDRKRWDLFVGVIESTDRVQHMMWRLFDRTHPMYDETLAREYGDAIERIYRRSDDFVGQVLSRLDPDTPVMIVSDHGFHSWRKAVNLNTWLVEAGFMVLKGQKAGEKKLDDLFGGGQFWENVDWSRTRAYAMGLGQVYFNLKGRESQGIVSTGVEYQQLGDELTAALMRMSDPETGQRIVSNVYKRDDVYSGEFLANASDLQVGFADGYRVSWQTALGGTPPGIVYPNTKKWSADHGSFDYQQTAGILVSTLRTDREHPGIIDIAPTVLKYFGVPVPGEIDGVGLWPQ